MKSTPIRFTGPMVQAIQSGRKTQTRRLLKPQPSLDTFQWDFDACGSGKWMGTGLSPTGGTRQTWGWDACPYGQPGDHLWVKETWCHHLDDEFEGEYHYQADGVEVYAIDGDGFQRYRKDGTEASPWISSRFMPRAASRITLEVTAVRVERLQDISETDALAEGVEPSQSPDPTSQAQFAIWGYRTLWESINGPGSWDANPWVWVVEFKQITTNQKQV